MGKIRFIGCLHFGDKFIGVTKRGFKTTDEHDLHLIDSWNEVVNDDDTTYILGDISNEDPTQYHKLNSLKGNKYVVMGNHDLPEYSKKMLDYVDGVCGMRYLELPVYDFLPEDSKPVVYKIWVTHAPLHPMELSFVGLNIHSHTHEMEVPFTENLVSYWGQDSKIISKSGIGYINVDAHLIGYKPKTIQELISTNKFVDKTVF